MENKYKYPMSVIALLGLMALGFTLNNGNNIKGKELKHAIKEYNKLIYSDSVRPMPAAFWFQLSHINQ